MPILSNVLIKAKEDHIELTTTNLDLGIRCKIQSEVSDAGSITLPVRKLATIVRELPSLDVHVETHPNFQARIASGTSLFRIMGINPEEFPPLPTFQDQHSFTLAQSALWTMLKSVSYAQSTDETRYIMNGVFFNFSDDKLTLAATDGRRLAVMNRDMEVAEENTGHLILPGKTVAEVERLMNQGEDVRIAFNDRQVAFEISASEDAESTGMLDSIHLVSKVVEGSYPNYRQVIPKETDRHIKLNRDSFLIGVRRAALVASEKSNSIKMSIGKNLLEITGSSPEIGESRESIPIEYDGPDVQVAFNPQFVMDPLKALTHDDVIFEFKNELSPGVIRTKESFLCVVMPLRLN